MMGFFKDNIKKFRLVTGIGRDDIGEIFAGLQVGDEEEKTNASLQVTLFEKPDLSSRLSMWETSSGATSKALVKRAKGVAAKLKGLSYNSVYYTVGFYEYD
ncbi:hypothetical protein [Coxiella endosymbiont of Ornithodoros maritimus]|uniref:hypothetical protein n=1 Tax=Coxiella endosymbiont of Ornithodoros maritimus TaxID=1656172 RepID=UPI002264D438|nr:hypothetical protein [Coxiella endosymbiont of Ornithodoros maritimus]